MRIKILYVERKFYEFFSIEKVFRQIARSLPCQMFESSFRQTKYLSSLTGIFKNLAFFKAEKADVYHVTGHITYMALVLPPEKTVLTFHDAAILYVKKGIRRFFLKKLLFDLPVRRAGYITAISETTKSEIVKYTGCAGSKIRVIENPLDEDFTVFDKKEFNADCPKILQIGTAAHKNLANVCAALENLKCQLIIVGRLDAETEVLLKKKKISFRSEFEVSDERIRDLYIEADIVVFCSLFEGFGLPVIEAQAMRTPVITSNLEPLAEVSGGAAILVDPHDPQQIRNAVERIINDHTLRDDLIAEGLENIKRFDHLAVAEKYANLYREIVADN